MDGLRSVYKQALFFCKSDGGAGLAASRLLLSAIRRKLSF